MSELQKESGEVAIALTDNVHKEREPEFRAGTLTYSRSGLAVLFGWLLWGDFCLVLMEALPNVLPLKFKSLGASATLISVILTGIPSLVLLSWNPIISTWSDRYRGKRGRRIPFILGGAPFMAMILIGIGFCDSLGRALTNFSGGIIAVVPATIVVLVLLILLFHMCNAFVLQYGTLFNDTVPREVIGRFSMLLRVISTSAILAYNFFIFPHAETHHREIFIGIGIFFALAYLLMGLNVKEGDYPPPTPLGRATDGWLMKVKGYFRECFGHRFYWYLSMFAALNVVGGTAIPFILLMNKSLGLDLKQIGWISGYAALITLPVVFLTGLFIDRCNVVKLLFYGRIAQTLITAGFMVFLFVEMSVRQVLIVTVALNLALQVVTAVMIVALAPANMFLLPRERFGQFSSAISVVVGVAGIIGSVLIGIFIDFMRYVHHGSDFAYRYAPLWMCVFWGLSGYCQYRVYCHVRDTHGNDLRTFIPPDTSVARDAVVP
jgi:maltose/moltooligosaccharide transporter